MEAVSPKDDGAMEKGEAIIESEMMGPDADTGARKLMFVHDPKLPSLREREEHQLTHLPYRSWCSHCVSGKGKEAPRRRGGDLPCVPEVHLDFMFMGDENGGKTLTYLVAKERITRALMATVVSRKSTGEFAATRVLAFMREYGIEFTDIGVKSDNEPAICSLVDLIGRIRAARGGGKMHVELSPVHSSASNGVVERGIQAVQGQIRVMRSAVETRLGVHLDVEHVVWPWLAEYAAYLLCRAEVGHDGKTAYERAKGKLGKIPGMEFLERVLWKRKPVGGPLGKLSLLWREGVFLGVKGSTGEYIVGDERGVWRTRTIQRKPVEERWQKSNLDLVVGVPWKKNGDDEKADGEMLKTEVIYMDEGYRERMEMKARDEPPIPRRGDIRRTDLEDHGYTANCKGCQAILKGKARQGHSEECRKRMEDLLKDEPRMKKAKLRVDQFLEEVLRGEEEKKEKSEDEGHREREGKATGVDQKMDTLDEPAKRVVEDGLDEGPEEKRRRRSVVDPDKTPDGDDARSLAITTTQKRLAEQNAEEDSGKRARAIKNDLEKEASKRPLDSQDESKNARRRTEESGNGESEMVDVQLASVSVGSVPVGVQLAVVSVHSDELQDEREVTRYGWPVNECAEECFDQYPGDDFDLEIKEGMKIDEVDPSSIQAARKEEMEYMNKIQMFE